MTFVNRCYSGFWRLKFFWQDYCAMWRCLNLRDELDELVEWAERKRLGKQRAYYQSLHQAEESRLLLFRVRYPKLVWFVILCRALVSFLPNPYRREYDDEYSFHQQRSYA